MYVTPVNVIRFIKLAIFLTFVWMKVSCKFKVNFLFYIKAYRIHLSELQLSETWQTDQQAIEQLMDI